MREGRGFCLPLARIIQVMWDAGLGGWVLVFGYCILCVFENAGDLDLVEAVMDFFGR